ncbi:MAG TPA: hypothetical protein VGM89_02195 [Puia sp.]|jgi:hypothetical protein
MKQAKKIKRTRRLVLYYTEEEYAALQQLFLRSNSRYIGVYVRKLSVRQPVEVKTRNSSFDDFVAEIIPLRKEMAALRRISHLSPDNETQLLELHRSIQRTIDKIATACMQV